MFSSKIKCPACGAENPKERMSCAECGAPLTLEAVDERPTEVPQESKPNLASTIKQTTTRKRRVWFWVGVILLTIHALFWLILIPAIIDRPDLGAAIVFIVLTAPGIGIGIYGIRWGRRDGTDRGH